MLPELEAVTITVAIVARAAARAVRSGNAACRVFVWRAVDFITSMPTVPPYAMLILNGSHRNRTDPVSKMRFNSPNFHP
jgi:hypothetical protein